MEKTNKYTVMYMPLGMVFGLSLGILMYGIPLGSVAVGMSIGIGVGLCFGFAIGAAKDAKINKQLEECGYRVKSVTETPDGFDIVVSDKNGAESAYPISQPTQKREKFVPGDYVYISGSNVTQAYNKRNKK